MSKIKTLIKLLRENPASLIRVAGHYGCLKWIPDKAYLKMIYLMETGQKLNLKYPKTYSEKLQWIKLFDRKTLYTKLVDKYEVRKYIAATIGENYLIKLIGTYNSVDEIDWNVLPNAFVLKCTHGSGSNIICIDKKRLDIDNAKIKLRKWMKHNWFWFGREWPYRNVKPRITCEEFLSDNGEVPEDYKVLCFNGKAKLIEVHTGRFADHKQDFYDIKWNKTEISQGTPRSTIIVNKPKILEKMLQLSEILSQNTYHVRIDWYVVENKLYFGEITFFDASGFCPFDKEKDELMLGDWIDLSN